MVVFLLKSSACLAILLMFYKLLLEKERMHTFKRYYLLAALVLALIIPSITFVEYIEVSPAPTPASLGPVENSSLETEMPIPVDVAPSEVNKATVNYWPVVLWTVYGLGVLLFFLKFAFNLGKITRNIRNNPRLKIDTIINVLLQDAVVPHTFLNYIFLNRKKFEAHEIPKDVLVHEATHAQQKHTLDVLFVELLQIVFWFNPLFYFAKKSIKLNHEFLADQAVLDQGASAPHYQNTLLAFASSANYKDHQPSMANAINYSSYSSIKKRFKVMKTQTSKKSILVRSLLLLPLLAILLYGFSENKTQTIVKKSSTKEIQKYKVQRPEQLPNNQTSHNTTKQVDNSDEIVKNVRPQEKATPEMILKYNTLAKKYNAQQKESRSIPSQDLELLEAVYRSMTEKQKENAQTFPECPDPKTPNQEGATKKQVGEYNSLAKKYNEMLAENGNIRIKQSEVDRLEYLFSIMTEGQRSDAEPFPDFPEPPEPPEPPTPAAAPNERMVHTNVDVNEQIVQEIIEEQDIYDELGHNIKLHGAELDLALEKQRLEIEKQIKAIEDQTVEMERAKELSAEQKVKMQEHAEQIRKHGAEMEEQLMRERRELEKVRRQLEGKSVLRPPAPPKPAAPKSPLELLEELKEDDVRIILDGEEIEYKKAEKLFKENNFSRINVRKSSENRAVLEVWTE